MKMIEDCECSRMCTYFDTDWLFGNGHNQKCDKFKPLGLWLYKVDGGEWDIVLAHDRIEALQLSITTGCNTDAEDSEYFTIEKLTEEEIYSGSFYDEDAKTDIRYFTEICNDKTPRVISCSIY